MVTRMVGVLSLVSVLALAARLGAQPLDPAATEALANTLKTLIDPAPGPATTMSVFAETELQRHRRQPAGDGDRPADPLAHRLGGADPGVLRPGARRLQ